MCFSMSREVNMFYHFYVNSQTIACLCVLASVSTVHYFSRFGANASFYLPVNSFFPFTGLLTTYVALNLMDGHGQPALLYIVPFTLGMLQEAQRTSLIVEQPSP